jgi:hypothetical protein
MRAMSSAEARKDRASASIATGAVRAWMSTPPRAGPATDDADRLALSLLLAAT